MVTALQEPPDTVRLADGAGLTVGGSGPLRPFVLIPDPGADAGGWDRVAGRLLAAGHAVATADLTAAGSAQAAGQERRLADARADQLSTLIGRVGFTGGREPLVVGHERSAPVALSLAARRGGLAAVGCVAGGWSGEETLAWYPLIDVPVLLCAVGEAAGTAAATSGLRRSRVSWYPSDPQRGPDAGRLADDLLALAIEAEPSLDGGTIPVRWGR